MSNDIRESLFSFHFGTIESERRVQVEGELVRNVELLKEYFSLKRNIEDQSDTRMPSDSVRRRLRHEAQSQLLSRRPIYRLLPITLSAATVTAIALILFYFLNSQDKILEPNPLVDSPQTDVISLNII